MDYVNKINGEHHIALVKGDIADGEPVLCRYIPNVSPGMLSVPCVVTVASSWRKLCAGLRKKAGVYCCICVREGRGIGLINKLKAYHLQDGEWIRSRRIWHWDLKADLREYGTGAEILADLGVKKMILMTNNPLKIKGLDGFGLEVVGREPIEMTCNEKNEFYMYTKYKKMGHILHVRNDWKKEE